MAINDYNLFDHVKLNCDYENYNHSGKNFESIDSLFSISGVTYTVSILNRVGDIERIETPMEWQEIALKVTVWFLSIITVIPIIAIIIKKLLHQQEITEIFMGGSYQLENLHKTIPYLEKSDLLTRENHAALIRCRSTISCIYTAISCLYEDNLLTQSNFDKIVEEAHREFTDPPDFNFMGVVCNPRIFRLIKPLHEKNLLTQENFNLLYSLEPSNRDFVLRALWRLENTDVLTQANFNALIENQQHSRQIARGINELMASGLLTQANFDALLQHPERAYDHALEIIREAEVYLNMTATVNVHTRDARCRAAMELLIRAQEGNISPDDINQGVRDFRAFLDGREESIQKTKALHALVGRQQEVWPALLGDQNEWSVHGLVLTGEEVIGRLWCFANTLQEPDQTNVKMGMIRALEESIENHYRICNPGKVSHLLHVALQGYLPGVNLDPETEGTAPISATQGAAMFFNANQTNLLNETINTRAALNAQGNVWLEENPRVTDREGFFRQLEEYANAENWP